MSDGSEPIADHEILYRRIPAASGFYDPLVDPNPSPLAFRPTKQDTTGVSRAREIHGSGTGWAREGGQAVLRRPTPRRRIETAGHGCRCQAA